MKTYEYRTDLINDQLNGSLAKEPVPVPNATKHLNTHAAQGWEPISITPGTNAQTYTGLFITLRKPTN